MLRYSYFSCLLCLNLCHLCFNFRTYFYLRWHLISYVWNSILVQHRLHAYLTRPTTKEKVETCIASERYEFTKDNYFK